MSWPTPSDYQDAIQNPHICFQDPELKTGSVVLGPSGLPKVASGNFASVYEIHNRARKWAVRCFLRQVSDQQRRYSLLSQYLEGLKLPILVEFEYLSQGILVKGKWYPIVKMEWVEGEPLHTYVEKILNDSKRLLSLAAQWRGLVNSLRGNNLAHGDLQHGNILVTPQGQMVLVDYDAIFLPTLRGERSPELGHPNYQHPNRTPDDYDERLDNFSALVIYTSLRALAADPSLWHQFHTGDNLIFEAKDFKAPDKSLLFQRLKISQDKDVQELAKILERCCLGTMARVPDFEKVVSSLYPTQLNVSLATSQTPTPSPFIAPTVTPTTTAMPPTPLPVPQTTIGKATQTLQTSSVSSVTGLDWNIILRCGALNVFLFSFAFGVARTIVASVSSDNWLVFETLRNHPKAFPIGICFFLPFSAFIALYIGYRRQKLKQAASNVTFWIQGLFSWFLYSFGAFLQIVVSLITLALNPATTIPAIGGMLLALLAFVFVLASFSFLGLLTIAVIEHMAGIWRLLGFSPVTGWAINGGLLGVVLGASEGFQRTGFPQAQRLVAALATPLALLLAIVPISKTTPFHPTALPSQIYKPNKTTRIVQVTANVREGAGTNFPKITVVDKGEVVELVGISPDGEWAKVRLSNGTVGYIHCKLLGTGHPKGLPERDKPIKNYRAHQNLTPSKPPESQELLKISKHLDSLVWSPLKELAGENDPEKIKRRAQNLLKQWERNEKEFKKHLIALLKLTEKVNCWDDEMKSEFYSALLTAYCGLGRFEDALRERERLESLRSKTGEPIFSAEDLKRIDDYVSAAQAIWRLKGEDKG